MDMMQFIITINDGLVKGKIIDLNTNFEYTNYRLDSIMGSFAFGVREEYEKILKDIRDKCFSKKYFILDQSNRLTTLINDKYHVLPEFLWDDSPDAGVFRNKRSNKWFALIMNIAYEKIDNKHQENVDVINIKLDNEVAAYLNVKGIYPAYHMNKKSWLTIVLDDTLSDDYILKLYGDGPCKDELINQVNDLKLKSKVIFINQNYLLLIPKSKQSKSAFPVSNKLPGGPPPMPPSKL